MITYADFTLSESIANYLKLLSDYPIFYYILGISIVLSLMVMLTLPSKRAFTITLITVIAIIIFTFYYRGLDMFNQITSIFNRHFYQNIFFYYWNTIIGLLLIHISIHEPSRDKVFKFIMSIFYFLILTHCLYSFYITNIVGNNLTLVVGNISPIIVIGNIILFVMYIYLLILKISNFYRKRKS